MGKICAFENCDSGTYGQVKQCKDLGLRRLSLFSVPKSLNEKRKWSDVVGHALTDKECLCELHFDKQDIIKVNRSGRVKKHYLLRKNAEPKAIKRRGSVSTPSLNNNQRKIDELHFNFKISAMDVVVPATEEPVEKTLPVVPNDPISTESASCGSADHLLRDSEESAMKDEVLTIEEPEEPQADCFSVHDIVEHFESHPLLQTWCWMMNPRQADSLVFTQLDAATGNIRLRLDVESDLSLKLRTPDEKVRQDIDLSVHSIEDLETALRWLEITPMCSGTGFEAHSRSHYCQGFVNVDDYAVNVRKKRCSACRQLRIRLQKRANRKKAPSANIRYTRSEYPRTIQQQQKRRLQRKVRTMQMELESSKEKFMAVNEELLLTAITGLPPSQQEAVKACFSAAKEDC